MARAVHQPGRGSRRDPYIEIEPWHAARWNRTPSFQNIAASADSADTDCTLDGSSYDTSCATWLADIGRAVGQLARPVIFTWGHEFNVAGQYPWSAGDTGSCGSSPCTPAQWVAAWNAVQAQIDGNGASRTPPGCGRRTPIPAARP